MTDLELFNTVFKRLSEGIEELTIYKDYVFWNGDPQWCISNYNFKYNVYKLATLLKEKEKLF